MRKTSSCDRRPARSRAARVAPSRDARSGSRRRFSAPSRARRSWRRRRLSDALAALAVSFASRGAFRGAQGALLATLRSGRAPRAALLVLDMLNDHLSPGGPVEIPRARDIVLALAARLEQARAGRCPGRVQPCVTGTSRRMPDFEEWLSHNVAGSRGAEGLVMRSRLAPGEGDRDEGYLQRVRRVGAGHGPDRPGRRYAGPHRVRDRDRDHGDGLRCPAAGLRDPGPAGFPGRTGRRWRGLDPGRAVDHGSAWTSRPKRASGAAPRRVGGSGSLSWTGLARPYLARQGPSCHLFRAGNKPLPSRTTGTPLLNLLALPMRRECNGHVARSDHAYVGSSSPLMRSSRGAFPHLAPNHRDRRDHLSPPANIGGLRRLLFPTDRLGPPAHARG